MTEWGGAGDGTIFRMTPGGKFTRLWDFNNGTTDGYYPYGGLAQGTDGNFYGVTLNSSPGQGVVFRLSVGLSPSVKVLSPSATPGSTVTILGTNLTGTTGVYLNGRQMSAFAVNPTGTAISFTVPSFARSGAVRVDTPHGMLSGDVNVRVLH